MSEPDNDSVSRFFQNALRRPRTRFREDDWKKMEAMLDASQPKASAPLGRWGRAALSVAALLLVSGVALFISVKDQKSLPSVKEGGTSEPKELQRPESNSPKAIGSDSRQTARATTITIPSTMTPTITFDATLSSSPLSSSQFSSSQLSPSLETDPVASALDDPIDSSMVQSDSTVAADSIQSDKRSSVDSRWSVMAAVSADFTSPGMHKFTSPGRAAAVVVYYHFNSALSVSLGVVSSNRTYWDTGDNYKTVDENFWKKRTNGMVADKALGSCSMLEIPLGLRYNIRHTEKINVYTSAQVASYFMFDETYRYVFKSPNPGALDEWHAKKPSHSLFGVANLAVGFERAISRRMMVGISPYLNIPLTHMGSWSNMKLYSVGTGFTFRYKFQRRSTL
jgi:hypothetical protein